MAWLQLASSWFYCRGITILS
uniref:Uncharacterized protein n=1 Tax=Anguilla anguilla TaxID=7936 RepID=A0A0E9PWV0_ANGAN